MVKRTWVRFNYFQENGAFSRNDVTGTYRVDFPAMSEAVNGLSELILTLQGNGDYGRCRSAHGRKRARSGRASG